MGFWHNVDKELNYQGISRKELSFKANISYTGIGLGIERNSMPGADTAVRIARVLGVSVEYLLGEDNFRLKNDQNDNLITIADEVKLLNKYKNLISSLERIPSEISLPIQEMIIRIGSK